MLPSSVAVECPPRLVSRPPGAVDSYGRRVWELAGEAGLELDDWQKWYLDGCLAFGPDARWLSFENGLVVPRQNGKGAIIEARMLAGLFDEAFGEQLLTYTAHEFKTAQEHFHRIVGLIESTPRLRKMTRHIRRASGAEAVETHAGTRLRFLARSAGSGRGFSGDVVFYDEAMMLYAAAVGALLPTMSARGDMTPGGPQIYYFGTAGHDEPGEVFAALRDRAIAGTDENLFFAEWSAGEADDHGGDKVDLDDRAEWARANPAPRITLEFTAKERAALADDEFARERLCIWGASGRQPAIDPDVWRALIDTAARPGKPWAFAVDVPPEGRHAAIARAGALPDGRVHVEVDSRPGTTWAVERLTELSRRRNAPVVIDGASRAVGLVPALVAAKVEPVVMGTRQVVTACGAFMDRIDESRLRHSGQVELALAVEAARKRKVGDAWAWHRRDSSADISPLVAATYAAHGLTMDPPRRKTGKVLAV